MEQYYTAPPAGRAAVRAEIKARAREIIGRNGVRLTFIVAGILFMLMFVAVGTITAALWFPISPLFEGYPAIYDNLYDISVVIDYVIIFFLVLPAGLGILPLSDRICLDKSAPAADMLLSYRRLPRTWLVLMIALAPFLIIAGVSYSADWLIDNVVGELEIVRLSGEALFMISSSIKLTAAAISVGALALAARLFFFPGLAMRKDMSVGRALSASFSASRGKIFDICGFVLSFAGWAILSIATLGIVFIIHLAPYFITSYMIYCRRIKGDLTHE